MSEWDDPVKAEKIRYGRIEFDSKLEMSWFITLESLGFDVWDHPGQVDLPEGGWWEPDLVVGDVACEVKPWAGESVGRLWKPKAAWRATGLPVLILRPGFVSSDWDVEKAGADWESVDGREWVAVFGDGAPRFEPYDAEMIYPAGGVRFRASLVESELDKVGFAMKHWSDGVRDD